MRKTTDESHDGAYRIILHTSINQAIPPENKTNYAALVDEHSIEMIMQDRKHDKTVN